MHAMYKSRRALRRMSADDPNLEQVATNQGKTIADIILLRKRIQAQVNKQLNEAQRLKLHHILKHRHSRHGRHGYGHIWWLSTRRR